MSPEDQCDADAFANAPEFIPELIPLLASDEWRAGFFAGVGYSTRVVNRNIDEALRRRDG